MVRLTERIEKMKFSVVDARGVVLGMFKNYLAAERFAVVLRCRDNQVANIVAIFKKG